MLQETGVTETVDVLGPIAAVAGGVVVAFVLATLISALVRAAARRSNLAMDVLKRVRRPMRVVLVIVGVWIALRLSTKSADWRIAVEHALLIALIVAAAWLIGALAFVAEDAALNRYRLDVPDNRRARRARTQIAVLRRLTVALLAICAAAGVLMTFPSARAAGASVFASAGVISIVAGLAAQSSLANVFAGLQLAFTDAIRLDDVVVVDGEWGRIEEITMTYIVVHLWDDRRLIVPSTFFTSTPFENWTRRDSNMLGTVELDVDWEVPVAAMRDELKRLLEESDLWDERVGILQVTDAVGGQVQVRALASAVDAPSIFDLRCYVREGLVDWLQREAPYALPRTRLEGGGGAPGAVRVVPRAVLPGDGRTPPDAASVPDDEDQPKTKLLRRPDILRPPVRVPAPRGAKQGPAGDATAQFTKHTGDRLFTGSFDAVERAQAFGGPGREVLEEREQTAERALREPVPTEGDGKAPGDPKTKVDRPKGDKAQDGRTKGDEPRGGEPRGGEPAGDEAQG
ncbi:mechanosensitive ion channel family protein [Pengzhenrongella sp.]|jgi:small-conductance mechanosensitive channel|uniref:mechanosensitive ion channel family protein n=1 Tax=Pengzhenrongella sp. TaxID=2888820 RepID=UPI002F93AF04